MYTDLWASAYSTFYIQILPSDKIVFTCKGEGNCHLPLTLIYEQHFAIAERNLSDGTGQHIDISKVSVLEQMMCWGPEHANGFVRLNDVLLLSCNQSVCLLPVVNSLQKLCCNLGLFPLAAQPPKRSAGTSPIEDRSLKQGACLHQTYTWASFLSLYSKQLLLCGMTD